MLLLVVGSVAGSSSRSRRILTCSRRSTTLESINASSVAGIPASSAAIRGRSCRMAQGCGPHGKHVASILSLLGSREERDDLLHSQSSFSLPNAISHNVYYVRQQSGWRATTAACLSAFLIVVILPLTLPAIDFIEVFVAQMTASREREWPHKSVRPGAFSIVPSAYKAPRRNWSTL